MSTFLWPGGSEAVQAAKDATDMVPIVMTNSGDPVAAGFVASLSHPGGNVTGLTQIAPQLAAKRLELLRETVGKFTRVGVLWNPAHPVTPTSFRELHSAAIEMGIEVHSSEVQTAEGIPSAIELATQERVGSLMVLRDPFTLRQAASIAEQAAARGLPAIYESREFVEAGGMMLYGPNVEELYRRAAVYVDRILKGARPADLPVERPSRFDLVINLPAAQALGLTIPSSVLQQATEVIQ